MYKSCSISRCYVTARLADPTSYRKDAFAAYKCPGLMPEVARIVDVHCVGKVGIRNGAG